MGLSLSYINLDIRLSPSYIRFVEAGVDDLMGHFVGLMERGVQVSAEKYLLARAPGSQTTSRNGMNCTMPDRKGGKAET